MSQLLKEFYRAYLKYLKGEANPCAFDGHMGLCGALTYFGNRKRLHYDQVIKLKEEMRKQFREAGLCQTLPFNNCVGEWTAEQRSGRMPYNYRRIDWVTKGAA